MQHYNVVVLLTRTIDGFARTPYQGSRRRFCTKNMLPTWRPDKAMAVEFRRFRAYMGFRRFRALRLQFADVIVRSRGTAQILQASSAAAFRTIIGGVLRQLYTGESDAGNKVYGGHALTHGEKIPQSSRPL